MLDKLGSALLALHRASREQATGAFQDAAFEAVKSVIPFDSSGWMTGGLAAGGGDIVFNTLHLYNQPPQLVDDWRRIGDRTSFFRKVFASPGISHPCAVARDMGPELAAHCKRYGVEHILATAHVDPVTLLYETISLWRADPDRPFTEDERRVQQVLVPHLIEAWRNNRIHHLATADGVGTPARCCAAADGEGVLHLIEPAFTSLLQQEWPDWRGARLPDALAGQVAAGTGQFVGEAIVVTISRLHNQFLLQGRAKSTVDTLGQSKLAVAKHFSEGRTHKEIAQLLGLAPATVRNYLASVYDRLGISSKAELANLLREHNK